MATILSEAFNSHVKKTIDLVFFCILVVPINSCPSLTTEINFNSKEMVTLKPDHDVHIKVTRNTDYGERYKLFVIEKESLVKIEDLANEVKKLL